MLQFITYNYVYSGTNFSLFDFSQVKCQVQCGSDCSGGFMLLPSSSLHENGQWV